MLAVLLISVVLCGVGALVRLPATHFERNELRLPLSKGQNRPEPAIDRSNLKSINSSRSATEATRILDESVRADGRLFGSVSIPTGASVRGLSDVELAIQTRLTNKRVKITDLVDLSGNRDADRASVSVLAVFISSTIAASK